jgi:hypothetical protein
VLVVNNLLAHINRCAIVVEGFLNGNYRTVDPGAIAAG